MAKSRRLKANLSSNQIAFWALGLSIISFGFAVYQWWSSGRQEHIRAAIELSDKYIDQAVSADLLEGEYVAGTLTGTGLDPAKRQYARIEYIAFLVNHGLVNPSYLAQRTICDIVAAADPDGYPEALAFKHSYPKTCLAEPKAPDSTDDQTSK